MTIFRNTTTALLVVFFVLGMSNTTLAATTISLDSASNFAVIGNTTITNTGSSVINGDLALSPGTSITGFPPGVLNGIQAIATPAAVAAQVSLTTAYNNAVGQTPATVIPAELGGTTKVAGIYESLNGTFDVNGTLVLDGQNDPNSVFIFRTSSTLITAGASNITLINDAQACNVFWQVGSSATLGSNSTFKGSILALVSATLTTGANVEGKVLVRNGAVTLDSNTITIPTCAAVIVTPTPEPIVTPEPTVEPTPIIVPVVATPVVVAVSTPVPGLPSTGFNPNAVGIPWQVPGIVIASIYTLVLITRKQTSSKRS